MLKLPTRFQDFGHVWAGLIISFSICVSVQSHRLIGSQVIDISFFITALLSPLGGSRCRQQGLDRI